MATASASRTQCSGCGKSIKYPPELAGTRANCPGCGTSIELGALRQASAAAASHVAPVTAASKARSTTDEPAGNWAITIFSAISLVMGLLGMVGGVVLIFLGVVAGFAVAAGGLGLIVVGQALGLALSIAGDIRSQRLLLERLVARFETGRVDEP